LGDALGDATGDALRSPFGLASRARFREEYEMRGFS
jgi:hypothetical protein